MAGFLTRPTTRRLFAGWLLCWVALSALGCTEEGGWVCDPECFLEAGLEVPGEMEIRYEAYAVGDGAFTAIRYLDNGEPEQNWVTVDEAPIVVPWAVDAGVYRIGMRAGIEAEGTLRNGTIEVRFVEPGGFEGGDLCRRMCSM